MLSPNGVGQVLLFPYYFSDNSGNGFSSLINIVNTTPDVKVVRVRFREGLEGASVGDFNVYLDGFDVWTVAVLATPDGAGVGTLDKTCTSPVISNDPANPTALTNVNYLGGPGDVSLARTREGYVEVIEMGDFGPAATASAPVPSGIIHVNGLPRNCGVIVGDTGEAAGPPTGGLFGSIMLISVTGGVDYYYPATALNGFSDQRIGFGPVGSQSPTLADAHPAVSVVRDGDGRTIRSEWPRGIDAVSATLMSDSIQGEYVLEPVTLSRTNWVVTMPTKWYYVNHDLAPTAPFLHAYSDQGACETIQEPLAYPSADASDFGAFSRDGRRYAGGNAFGAPIPTFGALCAASMVMPFNDAWIFVSQNPYRTSEIASGASSRPGSIEVPSPSGWGRIALFDAFDAAPDTRDLAHQMTSGATAIFNADGSVQSQPSMTYIGLPVIGFATSSYYNGTLTDSSGRNVLSTYIAGTALRTHLRVQ